ncbi:MAG TPA: serine/threonine-protein kinase [Kofleriaceae bacterium]|nr:serine/threonine-protein kinase [Kofleriaceae bacterium]
MEELPAAFGKYYLTEKLATGGMAEIYLGKLIGPGGFEKQLVIKQIHPKLTGQRHFVDLFVAEAKTLVTLAHGNIVPVYELGVIDDTYFIAMEYIDGPTLYRLTETMAGRDARMDPSLAAWISARILEGLDYAHRKGEGVIHRDLSPRNVMLSRDGEVKLVDFGIAVALGEPGEAGTQSAPTGSFPYMSPEQVRREPLTAQSDVFSAGVLCWEMLVGERLFARAEPDATLEAVLRGEIPRPSSRRPEVAGKLEEVVMRALERDQAARWASAGEMLAALNRYLYALDATPGPREAAALVAKFCPPETRRLPTHLEAAAHEPGADDRPVPSGPRTAVVPRDRDSGAAVEAKGKRPHRHQTFATHVELQGMLDRNSASLREAAHPGEAGALELANPPAPAPPTTSVIPRPTADDDDDDDDDDGERPDPVAMAEEDAARSKARPITNPSRSQPRLGYVEEKIDPEPAPARQPEETAESRAGKIAPRLSIPREPPSRRMLVVAAFLALALGAAAIYVFFRGRGAVLAEDAATAMKLDAAAQSVVPPAPRDAPTPPIDAADLEPDAPPVPPPDAAIAIVHPPLRVDAGVAVVRVDAAPVATGIATLSFGADPWAEVFIDDKSYGRTPINGKPVPAGHHTVRFVYSPENAPPRTQTFAVDLAAGDTKPLFAQF